MTIKYSYFRAKRIVSLLSLLLERSRIAG